MGIKYLHDRIVKRKHEIMFVQGLVQCQVDSVSQKSVMVKEDRIINQSTDSYVSLLPF